jgi:ATP-dependent Clp protease ATP-binding subunit ClpA
MTTNIGECDIREAESKPTMGFITPDRSGDREKIFTDSLKKFSPEFIGRIDKIVHFNSLTVDDCVEIIK